MKSMIPEKVGGFRSAVINRLIDWAKSQTIIAGPGLRVVESESGKKISLIPENESRSLRPFNLRLDWNSTNGNFDIRIYLPAGLASWTRGASNPSGFDSPVTALSATIRQNAGWYATGLTCKAPASMSGDLDVYVYINTGGSYDITASPSTLCAALSSNASAASVGLQRHIAHIYKAPPNDKIGEWFEGNIEELGVLPL